MSDLLSLLCNDPSSLKTVTFDDLPNQLLLKIFSGVEAVSCSAWAEAETSTESEAYETVKDDTLEALVNGYQKRYCLPLVCKRWSKLLAQPSYLWASLYIDFHELWNIQQRFLEAQLFFPWISLRALSMQHLQLDFDSWCQQYYQGAFSSVQAGSSVGTLLQMLDGSLQQLKLQDAGFVVNQLFLDSLAASQHLQHLQLFDISSDVFVSDKLRALTRLVELKNLELGNRGESQEHIRQHHSSFFPTQVLIGLFLVPCFHLHWEVVAAYTA
ncbi:hypothetical protein ABBQ38_009729 [Trebouxia sp. C0009 RCD-2024]